MTKFKKLSRLIVSALSVTTLASCKHTTALSEQYFQQPTITENTMTVELQHKDESKWLDVIKQKATTIGLKASEYLASSKDPKNERTVYLRRKDVYNDDGEIKSKVQEEISKYDLKYLLSDYYTKDKDIITAKEALERDEPTEVPEESTTGKEPTETTPEEKPSEEPTSEKASEKDSTSSEEAVKDPYFPISYGTKDSLAAKFSFNIKKFIDELGVDDAHLFSLRVAMQKYDTKTAFLGSETFTLALSDDVISYAIPRSFEFNGKTINGYVALGQTVEYVSKYFPIVGDMLKVESKFEIKYLTKDDEVCSKEIDLQNTKLVDVDGDAAEGEFNIHELKQLTIQLRQKAK